MLRLVLGNLRNKAARTIITLLGLALATGTMFSLLAFRRGYERGLQDELARLGAEILVVPKGCPYDAASLALHGANWPCYLKENYLAQVAQTPGVAIAAPVLMAAAQGREREIVVGVTRDYLRLRSLWKIDGTFPAERGEVLLGAEAARRLNAKVGHAIQSSLLKTNLRVSGILQPVTGPDDDFTFMDLAEAQNVLRQQGHLTHVLVKLANPQQLERTVEALRGCDAGMQMNIVPLAHLFETIRRVSSAAQYLLGGIAAIAFVVGGTALANTMLMAVLERTREIGILRAIGASRRQIFSLFLGECLFLGLLGAVIGTAASWGFSHLLEQWARGQIAHAPESPLIRFDLVAMLASAALAVLVAAISGLLPAMRAARLHPVVAFRAQAAY